MLVLLQFPFADLRQVASTAGPAVGPDWGSPPDAYHPDFVRGFGGLRKRSPLSRRASGAWPAEAWFARAGSGIRLPQLTPSHFALAGVKLVPRHVVRRVFCDGLVMWRFEVGVGLELRSALGVREVVATVRDLLSLPVRVRVRGHWGLPRPLIEQGAALEEALTTSSTPLKQAASKLSLRRGRPMALVESTASAANPGASERVSAAPGSVHIRFGGDETSNAIDVDVATLRWGAQEFPLVWLRSQRGDRSPDVTALRVNLFRLHAEREALTSVLRALQKNELGTPSAELERYLAAADKNLFVERRDGIDQNTLRYAFSAYDEFVPDELQAIRTRLAGRRQTLERTERLIASYSGTDSRTLIVVEAGGHIAMTNNTVNVQGDNYGQINVAGTFVNNGTIINGIGDTKLKSATEALNKLAEQLAAKLPDVADKEAVANKTQAIVREAAAKKPDADLLKVTGKGLIEAARTVAEMAKPIATAVGAVLGILGIVL